MSATEAIEHGTYAGFQKCRRLGPTCDLCKKAQRVYMADWRRQTGRVTRRQLTDMEIAHLTGKSGDFL